MLNFLIYWFNFFILKMKALIAGNDRILHISWRRPPPLVDFKTWIVNQLHNHGQSLSKSSNGQLESCPPPCSVHYLFFLTVW